MRLFVALLPPPDVLAEIADVVGACRTEWPDLKWVPEEQWHVTLAFLGEVDDRVVPELEVRLARAASRHAPMTMSFSGAGAFPSLSRGHVFWVGLHGHGDPEGGRPPLSRLARSVAAGARRAGIAETDRKGFHPHLTLARSRREADLRPQVDALNSFAGRPWEAGAVHLMRSHQGPPVEYESIASWPLGSARRARPVD